VTYVTRQKKFGNHSTNYGGRKFDSKFEAGVARDLDLRKKAGEILDWEPQYRVDIEIFDRTGKKVHEVSHKVDFRVAELDGTFTLVEAKGFSTADYRFRRTLLEKIWLVEHQDHSYEVVQLSKGWRGFKPK
jgi:hypothetical protein